MLGIVVEDAPAGIRSGVAAGCRVLAVCTSHSRSALENLGAAWIVSDLSRQVLLSDLRGVF
jgi:beta-phosphoglucomutase-like phosphatase (HAD superfamily)